MAPSELSLPLPEELLDRGALEGGVSLLALPLLEPARLRLATPALAEPFSVLPPKALAAASVRTPVNTTLTAIIHLLARRSRRSAASRVWLVCVRIAASVRTQAKTSLIAR